MRIVTNEMDLPQLKKECAARLETNFALYLNDVPSLELRQSMVYSLQNGKYLRPLLVYATGSIFNAEWQNLDIPACAVELMHTYSLVHDDLPCMDNADTRRGQASCHKAFSESTAVLAGDGLQALAIQVLAIHPGKLKSDKRLQMVDLLTKAAGPYGMVSGQVMDLNLLKDNHVSKELLLETYKLKTGLLLSACVQLGWLASVDDDEFNKQALINFGDCIGLAFQIQDDILDVEGDSHHLGKKQNMDEINNKTTYVSLFGLEAAKEKVESLYQDAIQTINYLGYRAQLLRELTTYILERKR